MISIQKKINVEELVSIIKKNCKGFPPEFYEWVDGFSENDLPAGSSGSNLTAFYNNDYENVEDDNLRDAMIDREEKAYYTVLRNI